MSEKVDLLIFFYIKKRLLLGWVLLSHETTGRAQALEVLLRRQTDSWWDLAGNEPRSWGMKPTSSYTLTAPSRSLWCSEGPVYLNKRQILCGSGWRHEGEATAEVGNGGRQWPWWTAANNRSSGSDGGKWIFPGCKGGTKRAAPVQAALKQCF